MKKLIIILQIIIIILLLNVKTEQANDNKYFLMTATAYSNHKNCISDKWRDGKTATGTPIREGVVAINCDYVDGRWIVKSPLKLGDKIYIEGLGNYSVEDTGRFAERDYIQDMWTIDIYMEDYNEAVLFGRQLKKIFVLND